MKQLSSDAQQKNTRKDVVTPWSAGPWAGLALAAAMIVAPGAMAYEAGDIIVRAGAANIDPDSSSSGLTIPALDGVNGFNGQQEVAGTGVEVDDETQLGLTATYMFSSSLGVELLASTPFTHEITANLGGLGKVDAGEGKHLPPTLSLVWYPLGSENTVSPYVGAGVNYTIFLEDSVSPDLEAGLSAVADAVTGVSVGLPSPVPLGLELDNSWGLAAQLGVDVALSEQWHVNASVRWIDIDTEAEITSGGATIITVDDVEIDPLVYQLNIGFRF